MFSMEVVTKHILLESRKSINGLEVSDNLGLMNWYEAVEVCKKLGPGWRLPTKDELNMLYKNKEEIGGFASTSYWSSSEYDNGNAWGHGFLIGSQFSNGKNVTHFARAVRAS